MEKGTNNYHLDAKVIIDNMNPKITRFYNEKIMGSVVEEALYDILSPWLLDKEAPLSLEVKLFDVVCYLIETSMLKYNSIKDALDYFYNNKRSRKNYLYKVINNEYSHKQQPSNPRYLERYISACKLLAREENYDDEAIRDLINMKYEEIKSWRYSKESFIFEFAFFSSLEPKRQAENLLSDIGYEIFNIFTTKFHSSIGQYSVSIPSELIKGQFGPQKKILELSLSIDTNGNPISSNSAVIQQEDGSELIIETIADRLNEDYSELSEPAKKCVLSELKLSNGLLTRAEGLSYKDQETLTFIYSMFDVNIMNQEKMVFKGLDFCRRCTGMKNLRSKDVREVLKSLEKLACSEVRMETRKDDTVTGVSLVSFFDLRYGKVLEGSENKISLHSRVKSNSVTIDDELLMTEEWDIEIFPSYFLKEAWQEQVNAVIYSRQYDRIVDSKTRAYMMLLQNERLKVPDEHLHFFSYGFFRNKMGLSGRFSRVKSDIYSQLDSLMENSIIIESYTKGENGVTISFLPFTDLEQELYY